MAGERRANDGPYYVDGGTSPAHHRQTRRDRGPRSGRPVDRLFVLVGRALGDRTGEAEPRRQRAALPCTHRPGVAQPYFLWHSADEFFFATMSPPAVFSPSGST